jgi:predicted nucleic acid-binding protein
VIVLDASVVVDFVLALPPHRDTIVRRIGEHARELAAPYLLDAEVGQVLRRFVLAGTVAPNRAEQAIQDFLALGLTRYPHVPLLARAFELRDNATVYDALYLALAEALGATLLTRDAALGVVPGHRARVEVLA